MTTLQKGNLIAAILAHLKFHARAQNKPFDEGEVFFSLVFRTESELRQIAKLAGI